MNTTAFRRDLPRKAVLDWRACTMICATVAPFYTLPRTSPIDQAASAQASHHFALPVSRSPRKCKCPLTEGICVQRGVYALCACQRGIAALARRVLAGHLERRVDHETLALTLD